MRVVQFIFLFIIFACSNYNSKKNQFKKVNVQDIYFAINMVFNNLQKDEVMEGNQIPYLVDVIAKPQYPNENPSLKKRIDSIFSNDSTFIDNQLKQSKNLMLEQDSVKFKKLISYKLLEEIKTKINPNSKDRKSDFIKSYHKEFGPKHFYTVSIPIFSRNKKIFIIEVNTLNGGTTYVYKKKGTKWIHYTISHWIS